jgi:hypothetical protein
MYKLGLLALATLTFGCGGQIPDGSDESSSGFSVINHPIPLPILTISNVHFDEGDDWAVVHFDTHNPMVGTLAVWTNGDNQFPTTLHESAPTAHHAMRVDGLKPCSNYKYSITVAGPSGTPETTSGHNLNTTNVQWYGGRAEVYPTTDTAQFTFNSDMVTAGSIVATSRTDGTKVGGFFGDATLHQVTLYRLQMGTVYDYAIYPAPGCGPMTGSFTTQVNIDDGTAGNPASN